MKVSFSFKAGNAIWVLWLFEPLEILVTDRLADCSRTEAEGKRIWLSALLYLSVLGNLRRQGHNSTMSKTLNNILNLWSIHQSMNEATERRKTTA